MYGEEFLGSLKYKIKIIKQHEQIFWKNLIIFKLVFKVKLNNQKINQLINFKIEKAEINKSALIKDN